mmetsp:Transcript_141514/g.451996  ORF Transcript_141514/g.451996 Transcript_141514/m.451996 type:complete len:354 (+) Transcript_141514:1391-2452(+)
MLRACLVSGDEGQIDVRLHLAGELDFRNLSGLPHALHSELILRQIDALRLLELTDEVVTYLVVKVFATQRGVPIGRLHLEDSSMDLEDGDVEGAPTQIEDGEGLFLVLHPESQSCCCRLIDDAHNLQARNLPSVLRGLALRIVEVGRHCNHGLFDLAACVRLCCLLHLPEHKGRDLARRISFSTHLDPSIIVPAADHLVWQILHVLLCGLLVEASADQPLRRKDRVLRVRHCLPLRGHADQALAIPGHSHDRGCRAHALGILQHAGRASLHDRHARVRGAQVDTNDGVGLGPQSCRHCEEAPSGCDRQARAEGPSHGLQSVLSAKRRSSCRRNGKCLSRHRGDVQRSFRIPAL